MTTSHADEDERTSVERLCENEQTVIVHFESEEDRAPTPHAAFLSAFASLEALADHPHARGFAIAAIGPFGRVVASGPIPAGRAAIVGRHTSCAVRLAHRGVSLRHLAVLVTGAEDDLAVRVWDLETDRGFEVAGDAARALAARGPVCVAVGAYAIWLVPLPLVKRWKGAAAAEAWAELPAPEILEQCTPCPRAPRASWPEAPASRRVHAKAASPLEEEPHTKVAPTLVLAEEAEPEVPWGELRLQRAGRKERRRITAERLEHGLLVGRYARCGLVLADGDNQLSRVHLLLVRVGAEVWAIDAASVNGTTRNGQRLEAAVLNDGDVLRLGTELELRWTRVRFAEA